MSALDTAKAAATDALAEAWHAVDVDGNHPVRACQPQSQADVWSDVAQWATYLSGRPLPLDASGVPLLAEAMHADCFRREDHRPHALADCPSDGGSDGIEASLLEDSRLVIAWLAADPGRTTGALR